MKMYVWTDHSSFLAVAHANSVEDARKAVLLEMGESDDGSCPEREKARLRLSREMPSIYIGTNAEFALTDSAEVRERDVLLEQFQGELTATRSTLAAVISGTRTANTTPDIVEPGSLQNDAGRGASDGGIRR